MKVLVVDDSAANRLVLTALLKRVDHSVLVADGASSAMMLYAAEHPDIVFTDLNLGDGTSGIELARTLRGMSAGYRLRIALVTGDVLTSPDPAVDAVLGKPVSLADLTRFIEEKEPQ